MSSIKSIMEVHEQKKSLIISQFSNAMAYAKTQESFNNLKAQMQKELDALNEYTINRIQENYLL